MSRSQEVTLIVNADNSTMSFSPDDWQNVEDPVGYGGDIAFADVNLSVFTAFDISFHGTSIALYGYARSYQVDLDNRNGSQLSSQERINSYWYQSPPLSDQEHMLRAWVTGSAHIDYALIEAGSTTDLSAKTIFVDDANEEIWYTGQWMENVGDGFGPTLADSLANRTVHRSNTTGDSFEFRFAGTSMSVYGVSANCTMDFIIDGSIEHRKFPQDPVGFHSVSIYGNTTLTPGNHTLIVNITSVSSDAYFHLDYITYTPSFSFIHEKPTFISPENQQALPTTSPRQSLGLPIGAIVGIAIAGFSMVIFAGLFKCFWKQRSASRKEAKITSRVEPFATRFASDVKSRPNKWREIFPSEDMTPNAIEPRGEGSSHLASLRIPEVQFRMDSLTAEIQNSDDLTRRELLARNNMLTMQVERLMRENAPPEYGGSVVGLERSNSHSGTLPSYNYREETERS